MHLRSITESVISSYCMLLLSAALQWQAGTCMSVFDGNDMVECHSHNSFVWCALKPVLCDVYFSRYCLQQCQSNNVVYNMCEHVHDRWVFPFFNRIMNILDKQLSHKYGLFSAIVSVCVSNYAMDCHDITMVWPFISFLRMNCNSFDDPLTSPLTPSSGRNCNWFMTKYVQN